MVIVHTELSVVLLAFFITIMIVLCLVFPFIAIPLLVISVALYGFGKGFFGSLIESLLQKS